MIGEGKRCSLIKNKEKISKSQLDITVYLNYLKIVL
jgi:hypothetical protein